MLAPEPLANLFIGESIRAFNAIVSEFILLKAYRYQQIMPLNKLNHLKISDMPRCLTNIR